MSGEMSVLFRINMKSDLKIAMSCIFRRLWLNSSEERALSEQRCIGRWLNLVYTESHAIREPALKAWNEQPLLTPTEIPKIEPKMSMPISEWELTSSVPCQNELFRRISLGVDSIQKYYRRGRQSNMAILNVKVAYLSGVSSWFVG